MSQGYRGPIRDGNNNGLIYDGTEHEQPAPVVTAPPEVTSVDYRRSQSMTKPQLVEKYGYPKGWSKARILEDIEAKYVAHQEYLSAQPKPKATFDDVIARIKAEFPDSNTEIGRMLNESIENQNFDSIMGIADLLAMDARYDMSAIESPWAGSNRVAVREWATERFEDYLAPNGKTIADNFVEWFGDSKVVTDDGKPLVVYHGGKFGKAGEDKFENKNTPPMLVADEGFFFSKDAELASWYAGKGDVVTPVYLRLENPYVLPAGESVMGLSRERLKASGYDGWIAQDGSELVVFDADQIKSATANNGVYGKDGSIRKEYRGKIRDGNNNGLIYDGTEHEQAAPLKMTAVNTQASEFRNWFGGSKVVDSDGNPRVVYHGTANEFTEFSYDHYGSENDWGYAGAGFYFTSDPDWANGYAEVAAENDGAANVLPVYLRLENPKVASSYREVTGIDRVPTKEEAEAAQARLRSEGYDGVVIQSSMPGKGGWVTEFVVFDPSQIKSALSNTGKFTRDEADIRKQYRGPIRDGNNNGLIYDGTEHEQPAPEKPRQTLEQTVEMLSKINPEMIDYVAQAMIKNGGDAELIEQAVKKLQGGRSDGGEARPEIVEWAKDRFGDRQAPGGSSAADNFVEWFGQSKAVGKDGKPLVLYHGSEEVGFNEFKISSNPIEPGIFFTDNPGNADGYHSAGVGGHAGHGSGTYPVFLALEDPLDVNWEEYAKSKGSPGGNQYNNSAMAMLFREAKSQDKDGLIIRGISDSGYFGKGDPVSDVYVAFYPEQVKSASANVGTFDVTSKDILKSIIGKTYRGDIRDGNSNGLIYDGTEFEQAAPVVAPVTESPQFRAWFGDSKVVDENGKPMVVYHGTIADENFDVFNTMTTRDIGAHFGDVDTAGAFVATKNYFEGARMYPVYLSIQNPLRTDDMERWEWGDFEKLFGEKGWAMPERPSVDKPPDREEMNALGIDNGFGVQLRYKSYLEKKVIIESLESKGYDGIVYHNKYEGDGIGDSYVAFRPSQIKSATGNRGTFDPKDPDITKAYRGGIRKDFQEHEHPRDDHGRFVDKERIVRGGRNPVVAGRLMREVHRPKDRQRLIDQFRANGMDSEKFRLARKIAETDATRIPTNEDFRAHLIANKEKWFLDDDQVEDLVHRYSRDTMEDKINTLESSEFDFNHVRRDVLRMYLTDIGNPETARLRLYPTADDVHKMQVHGGQIDPEEVLFVRHRTTDKWAMDMMEYGIDANSAPPDMHLGRLTLQDDGSWKQSRIQEPGLFVEPNEVGYETGLIIQVRAKDIKLSPESEGLGYKDGVSALYGAKDAVIAGAVIPPENIVGYVKYNYETHQREWIPNLRNPNSGMFQGGPKASAVLKEYRGPIRDGNNNGLIYDGTQWEQAAPALFDSEAEELQRMIDEGFERMAREPTAKPAQVTFDEWLSERFGDDESKKANFKKWFGGSKVIDEAGNPKQNYKIPIAVFHGSPRDFDAFDTSKIKSGGHAGRGFYFAENRAIAETFANTQYSDSEDDGQVVTAWLALSNPMDLNQLVTEQELIEFQDFIDSPEGRAYAVKEAERRALMRTSINVNEVATKIQNDAAGAISVEIDNLRDDIEVTWASVSELIRREAGAVMIDEFARNRGHDGLVHTASDQWGSVLMSHTGEGFGKCWVVFEPTAIKHVRNSGAFSTTDPNFYKSYRGPIRDGNNNGLIYDGTPWEQPAPAVQDMVPRSIEDLERIEAMAAAARQNPEFIKWFGDSKIVNENGEAEIVWRGDSEQIEQFDPAKVGRVTELLGAGFHFAKNRLQAHEYGEVRPYFIRLSNPHVVDAEGRSIAAMQPEASDYARRHGHDGVIITNVVDGKGYVLANQKGWTQYVVLDPKSIKSVGNSGAFSESDRVYKSYRGPIRDGNNNGLIYDGTEHEQAAPDKWDLRLENLERRRAGLPELPKSPVHAWALERFGDPVKAESFARWFGDSKALDEDGNPMVVYHGTSHEFTEFDFSRIGANTGNEGHHGYGVYLSTERMEAETYGDRVIEAFVSIKKPFIPSVETFDLLRENGIDSIDEKENLSIEYNSLHAAISDVDPVAAQYLSLVHEFGYEVGSEKFLEGNPKAFDHDGPVDLNIIGDLAEHSTVEPRPQADYDPGLPHWMGSTLEEMGIADKVKFHQGYRHMPAMHWVTDLGARSREVTEVIRSLGYDGIISGSEIVVFEPSDVKSIDASEFDSHSGDIYRSLRLLKEFREHLHPRDDMGRFIEKADILEASQSVRKAVGLMRRANDPMQRAMLVEALRSYGWGEEEFKAAANLDRWFGGSMVTDASGSPAQNMELDGRTLEPMVVYHGTPIGGWNVFEKDRISDPDELLYGDGFYFTEDPDVAGDYSDTGDKTVKMNEAEFEEFTAELGAAIPDDYKLVQVPAQYGLSRRLYLQDTREERGAGEIPVATDGGDSLPGRWKTTQIAMDKMEEWGLHDAAQVIRRRRAMPEVKKVYLKIENAFDADAPITSSDVEKAIASVELNDSENHYWLESLESLRESIELHRNAGRPLNYKYKNLATGFRSKAFANEIIRHMGYDGITHIGGMIMGDGHKHRVWIAFEPTQIKAVDNIGTFDPNDPDITKAFNPLQPRDDWGRWVKGGDIVEAAESPAAAAELRSQVTDPVEREKLDEAIDDAQENISVEEYNAMLSKVQRVSGMSTERVMDKILKAKLPSRDLEMVLMEAMANKVVDKAPIYRLRQSEYIERERVKEIARLKAERESLIEAWDDIYLTHQTKQEFTAEQVKLIKAEGVRLGGIEVDEKSISDEIYEVLAEIRDKRYDRRLRVLQSRIPSNWEGAERVKHAKAVEQAVKRKKDVPDEVIEQYEYNDWMPVDKKEKLERKRFASGVNDVVSRWGEIVAREYPKYEAVREVSESIRQSVLEEELKHTEYSTAMEAKLSEANRMGIEAYDKAVAARGDMVRPQVLALPADDPVRLAYEMHYEEFRAQAERVDQIGTELADKRRTFNQKAWSLIGEDPGVMITLTGDTVRDAEDAIEFFSTVLSREAHEDHVVDVKYLTEKDPYGPYRAFHQDGTIHVRPDESTAVVVHEIAHGVEINARLSEASKAFVIKQSAGAKAKSFGEGYKTDEAYLPDKLINSYSGKWYHYGASEVISVGFEELYKRPYEFARKAPEHFNYVVAVARGLIRGKQPVVELEAAAAHGLVTEIIRKVSDNVGIA